MKTRAARAGRCVEHDLTLGKDGRCALCRISTARAARRGRWVAGLAVLVCALSGGFVWGRLPSPGVADVPDRLAAPVLPTAPRTSRARPGSPQHPAPSEARSTTSGASRAGEAMSAPSSAPIDGAPLAAEDRALAAAVRVPPASRLPAPRVPDAPPPIALDEELPPDDPRDFELPTGPRERKPWSPPP
jgi:hypothetical protein